MGACCCVEVSGDTAAVSSEPTVVGDTANAHYIEGDAFMEENVLLHEDRDLNKGHATSKVVNLGSKLRTAKVLNPSSFSSVDFSVDDGADQIDNSARRLSASMSRPIHWSGLGADMESSMRGLVSPSNLARGGMASFDSLPGEVELNSDELGRGTALEVAPVDRAPRCENALLIAQESDEQHVPSTLPSESKSSPIVNACDLGSPSLRNRRSSIDLSDGQRQDRNTLSQSARVSFCSHAIVLLGTPIAQNSPVNDDDLGSFVSLPFSPASSRSKSFPSAGSPLVLPRLALPPMPPLSLTRRQITRTRRLECDPSNDPNKCNNHETSEDSPDRGELLLRRPNYNNDSDDEESSAMMANAAESALRGGDGSCTALKFVPIVVEEATHRNQLAKRGNSI